MSSQSYTGGIGQPTIDFVSYSKEDERVAIACDEIIAEREQDRLDAARYRWLRDTKPWPSGFGLTPLALNINEAGWWDKTIDEAMKQATCEGTGKNAKLLKEIETEKRVDKGRPVKPHRSGGGAPLPKKSEPIIAHCAAHRWTGAPNTQCPYCNFSRGLNGVY